MRKQMMAFLSLFSIILMLSVYYVTLPNKDSVKRSYNVSSNVKEPAKKVEKRQANVVQSEIKEHLHEQRNQQSSVLADKKTSEQEKKVALEQMDQLQKQDAIQDQVKKELQAIGFKTSVELIDKTCKIVVYDAKDCKENANKVMICATSVIKDKYLVEVTFK